MVRAVLRLAMAVAFKVHLEEEEEHSSFREMVGVSSRKAEDETMDKLGWEARCKVLNRIGEALVQTSMAAASIMVETMCRCNPGILVMDLLHLQGPISSSKEVSTRMATTKMLAGDSILGMVVSMVLDAGGRGSEAGDVIAAEACRPMAVVVASKGGNSSMLEAMPMDNSNSNIWQVMAMDCSISSLVAAVMDRVQVRRQRLLPQSQRRMQGYRHLKTSSVNMLMLRFLNQQRKRNMC